MPLDHSGREQELNLEVDLISIVYSASPPTRSVLARGPCLFAIRGRLFSARRDQGL
jgi:hypothetical protein